MKRRFTNAKALSVWAVGLAGALLIAGCPVNGGGTTGITGTVTNATTGDPVAGAAVSVDPAPEHGGTATTAADGTYTIELAAGDYTVSVADDRFEAASNMATVTRGATTVNFSLTPTAAAFVTTSVEGDAAPGGTVTVTANVEILDGSTTVTSYSWSQSNSVTVNIASPSANSTDVTLPDLGAYRDELITKLSEPPITADQLPENVPVPDTEAPGGLQDRFQVVGPNPFALEEAGAVELTVTVETSSGTLTATADVATTLPFKPGGGILNVPINVPVLLHGRTALTAQGDPDTSYQYDWALSGPGSATLSDATSQSPYFTPDATGKYTVTVTDPADGSTVTMEIYAGTFVGAITGIGADGRPDAANCTVCHKDGGIAPDKFTTWRQTGHAEIFTDQLNTGNHWGTGCFLCHSVGYNPDDDNGGLDEATDYDAWLNSGLINAMNPDAWATTVADYPSVAQLANIQCENCHGPQGGDAHTTGASRVTLSADNCGQCHGEPLRHGRFQQWQLSGHANYELAIDEGTNGSCARCHTANGFLTWLPILLDDDPNTDPTANIEVTWTADDTHPQTCVTCHDPHNIGTVSGNETDATVRISGDTPPLIAGFTVTDVGRGAICMTCHNSRHGLYNDDTYDDIVAAGTTSQAPHGSAQTDVLVGENAFFVDVGTRGPHSLVTDACVACHMQATPPPDALSYEQGGTNHTFYAAPDICSECHGDAITDASSIQTAFQTSSDQLKGLIETAMTNLLNAEIAGGNTIDLGGEATLASAGDFTAVEFGTSHGRQAISVTLADDTVVGPIALNNVKVIDGTDTDIGELYAFADAALPKAGWNYFLVNNDSSKGVHNPSFVTGVLNASIGALNTLNGG